MVDDPATGRQRATAVLLVVGLPSAALVGLLQPLPALSIRLVLVAAGIVAVVAGVGRHRPPHRRPWWLLLGGLMSSLVGDLTVLASYLDGSLTATVPLDSWLTALSGLLFLIAVVDATGATRRAELGGLLDAVVVAVAAGTVTWSMLVVPSAAPGWIGGSVEVAGSLQILVFAAVLALLGRTHHVLAPDRRFATGLAAAALVCGATAFLLGALTDAAVAVVPYTGARASFGAAANLLIGAAALHPTMRWMTEHRTRRPEPLSGARTTWLGVGLLTPPAILWWSQLAQTRVSITVIAGAWVVLVPSVLTRLYLLGRDQLTAEQTAATTERRLAALVAHTGDVILLVHTDGTEPTIAYASPASRVLLGRSPDDLIGVPVARLVTTSTRAALQEVLALAADRLSTADVRTVDLVGHPRWLQVVADRYTGPDEADALVVTFRDVTQRKTEEQRWVDAALHDPGTGLANRRAIEDRLDDALVTGTAGTAIAVLMCDLDGFKAINDAHGHAVGDAALRQVAERLRGAVRQRDVVGRLGGDEFVVLCSLEQGRAALDQVAARIVTDIARPFLVEGVQLRLGCSVGVTTSAPGDTDARELLHEADLALYRAKAAGKGRVVWHDGLEPSGA